MSDVDRAYWDAMAEVHGEVVTSCLDAGLRVEAVREHLEVEFDPRGDVLAREEDGLFRLRLADTALPLLFTLVASTP